MAPKYQIPAILGSPEILSYSLRIISMVDNNRAVGSSFKPGGPINGGIQVQMKHLTACALGFP